MTVSSYGYVTIIARVLLSLNAYKIDLEKNWLYKGQQFQSRFKVISTANSAEAANYEIISVEVYSDDLAPQALNPFHFNNELRLIYGNASAISQRIQLLVEFSAGGSHFQQLVPIEFISGTFIYIKNGKIAIRTALEILYLTMTWSDANIVLLKSESGFQVNPGLYVLFGDSMLAAYQLNNMYYSKLDKSQNGTSQFSLHFEDLQNPSNTLAMRGVIQDFMKLNEPPYHPVNFSSVVYRYHVSVEVHISIPKFLDDNVNSENLLYSAVVADAFGNTNVAWLHFFNSSLEFSGTPKSDPDLLGYFQASSAPHRTVNYQINVTASDGYEESAISFWLEIYNYAPNYNESMFQFTSRTIHVTEQLEYTIPKEAFTDPDPQDSISFQYGSLPAWLSFSQITNSFIGTPTCSHLLACN